MTDASRAIFLSYASEDVEAAGRIAEALRAAGIEVWFDRSELRGGDAWDRNIRDQIHQCRLFVPLISAHSQARDEGYFRREWAMAEDRTRDMVHSRAFLLPVVIDETKERGALVPEKFLNVQWTRLPAGNADVAFVERVRRLLTTEVLPSPPTQSPRGNPADGAAAPLAARRASFVGVAGAAALAVLIVAYIAYVRHKAPVSGGQVANSIAVLPLANESGDPNQQYFSDGLSENLITALTQFPGLKVIGRTSAFQFRDSKEDARSIGAKLGVARLLEGSVQRSGDVVRVSTELIDTADGSTGWSERYDRPYRDLFSLQDDITRAVTGALRAKLLPGEHAAAQSDRPPSGNLEAYNAVLQGRFYYIRATEADTRKAIQLFGQATQLDPKYAFAWSELSIAWTTIAEVFAANVQDKQAACAAARAASDRALALSPELAAAHNARGYLLKIADLDWREAEQEFRRALAVAPNDADAKAYLGFSFATFGDIEPAIAITKLALTADPLRDDWYYNLSNFYSGLSQLDEAEKTIRRAIDLQPAAPVYHWQLTVVEIQRGDAKAALEAAQHEVHGPWQDIALALVRQLGPDRAAAEAALRTLIDESGNIGGAFATAEVYALRNDADKTFEWLDRAWNQRDSDLEYLLFDPFILRFKADPRFSAFCHKVGLPVPGEKRLASNS